MRNLDGIKVGFANNAALYCAGTRGGQSNENTKKLRKIICVGYVERT
jgi:putative hemolysin